MTLADLIKDFIDTTKERLKTPISGAFLWSFIIYNWRPILLLFFSNASIENKIIVINHEYCNFWAIFLPVVIATFYTLLIPKIMLLIESDLAPTQDDRVTKRYEAEKHVVKQKTNVAREEFLLKNAESGNKEIQELLDQIESLKQQNDGLNESIKQINDSNNATINELNNRLKISNDILIQAQKNFGNSNNLREIERQKFNMLHDTILADTVNLEEKLVKEVLKAADALTLEEYLILRTIDINKKPLYFDNSSKTNDILHNLSGKNILHYDILKDGPQVTLSNIGIIIANIIQTSYL